jgi:hypothetical protein
MKKTYVYDQETGRMVEVTKQALGRKGPAVWGDIEPYQVVGPEYGKWITSRSKHREYLRRHNLIEVGNERKYFDSGD